MRLFSAAYLILLSGCVAAQNFGSFPEPTDVTSAMHSVQHRTAPKFEQPGCSDPESRDLQQGDCCEQCQRLSEPPVRAVLALFAVCVTITSS